jgi:hypothetical protein
MGGFLPPILPQPTSMCVSPEIVIDFYSLWHFVQPHSIAKCTILAVMIVMSGTADHSSKPPFGDLFYSK